ncbi:uncharacterized protein LOC123204035 isoform X2 [Mangifera indica]|uniref:uncharacterized protein LOC123204035 isoform X2 n=1 Tax=Mangifera indica TaxID=29780 RepID=UPI001CFAEA9B|nr:uncharacterized protein LOC123204035 isoform X2 [Mangifera indica]
MEEKLLDCFLVPAGLLLFTLYHVCLLYCIIRYPRSTVIGLNAESRYQWVLSMMTDPLKNGVLAVQTLRNNIMASTVLATTAITLSSLISVYSIRYYAHVSFLATLPTSVGKRDSIEYVARNLNRGSFFWSVGLRAFYLSFSLFLWIFGPIPMFVCCCIMSVILYFLDTTTSFTRHLHTCAFKDAVKPDNLESSV